MIFDYRCKGTKNYLYTQEKVQKKMSGCYLSRALSSIHVPKLRFSREYSDVLALPIANTAFGLRWGPPTERRERETTQTKSPGIEMISGLRKWRLPVCSMLALNPQTGESSGASLGVPSEALLHRHNAAVHIGSLGTALRRGEVQTF